MEKLKSLPLRQKQKLNKISLIICLIGFVLMILPLPLPVWLTGSVTAIGAAVSLGSAYLCSVHNIRRDEDYLTEEDFKVNYQTMGMAAGMCLGASIGIILNLSANSGMIVCMMGGFLLGSLIKRPDKK